MQYFPLWMVAGQGRPKFSLMALIIDGQLPVFFLLKLSHLDLP